MYSKRLRESRRVVAVASREAKQAKQMKKDGKCMKGTNLINDRNVVVKVDEVVQLCDR